MIVLVGFHSRGAISVSTAESGDTSVSTVAPSTLGGLGRLPRRGEDGDGGVSPSAVSVAGRGGRKDEDGRNRGHFRLQNKNPDGARNEIPVGVGRLVGCVDQPTSLYSSRLMISRWIWLVPS